MAWREILPGRLLGGFEAATMLLSNGRRVDSASGNRHDVLFERDYDLLLGLGIAGVRESLRWNLMEPSPGVFNTGELTNRLVALERRGMRALWSLNHFGVPDWMDFWAPSFPEMLADYAVRVATLYRSISDAPPVWSPVNEISFWAWAGDKGWFAPCTPGGGHALKRQLVRAAIMASRALRDVDPRCRLVHIDPIVNIVGEDAGSIATEQAGAYEAWDMIAGRLEPELGGAPSLLDVVGVNFYPHNQRTADGTMISTDHPGFVPFHRLLDDVARRYQRPILVTETGTEGPECAAWLDYMSGEMHLAATSMDLAGLCLYPVLDYPGWEDGRHCECGLIASDPEWKVRWVRSHMENAVSATHAKLADRLHPMPVPGE
jgi:beta-glucosidase/6-phospho-beta-glucosidase/beta-galactosidase